MNIFNEEFAVRLDTLNIEQREKLFRKMRIVMGCSPIGGMPMYHKYLRVGPRSYLYTSATPKEKRINIRTIKRIFNL